MNIAIDIDDTLTESFDYFLPYVAQYFGAEVEELKRRQISYSNLPPEWKKDEINFCKTYYNRIVARTPFKKDAAWGIEKLREQGHKIIIITGRTTAFYTDPYKTTEEELKNGGIVYDKLICTLDKANACLEEKISILIDDLPANCAAAASIGIPAIMFSSKANRDADIECLRVDNWLEAVQAAAQIRRGYPNRQNAETLLHMAGLKNPGPWVDHSKVAANCAEKIAQACGMDGEKAYVLGLLHDVGRRFLIRDLGHLYYGYLYMLRLGFDQVAKICLSHSFPNQDLRLYIGKIDIPKQEADTVDRLISEMVYDDYDRLIHLCDAMAGTNGAVDIEERMEDVKRRYGNYPQAQWDKNMELKRYFEAKSGKKLYDFVR